MTSNPSTAVVTGGTRGIGRQVVARLARAGWRTLLLARDVEAGERVAAELAGAARGPVEVVEGDLSSLASIRAAADTIRRRLPALDALVNNAATLPETLRRSEEGIELQLAVTHLGHFALTRALLPPLAAAGGRVVTVSSRAHYGPAFDFSALPVPRSYSRRRRYQQSKLANVLFTRELARRLDRSGVTANSVHPGPIATELLGGFLGLFGFLTRLFPGPEVGAERVARLVTDPAFTGVSGRYFHKLEQAEPSVAARSDADARRLWSWSSDRVGLPDALLELQGGADGDP